MSVLGMLEVYLRHSLVGYGMLPDKAQCPPFKNGVTLAISIPVILLLLLPLLFTVKRHHA